ncbi:MAG: sulfatase [Candidatus Hydrogenedentes bacterium]|nr:sulfatase [Candidatus Hydrogenedentota bacterium]
MNRREFIASAAALPIAASAFAQPAGKPKRNVILYITDDQGRNDAACFGNPNVKTPGIDALAKEGVRFTHAFCTTPSCSPSRSVILTGTHNHSTGQYGLAHAKHHFVSFDTVKSLPNILNDAGFRTLNAGKYHTQPEAVYHFQEYIKTTTPVDMAEKCRPLIESNTDTPFFLCFCTTEPHRKFQREGSDPIDPASLPVPSHLPDIPECKQELAEYYMSIQRADSGLVRLMEILKSSGHWEDTLIVFVSDNGMPWPGAKTTLYEPGINLPCVIRDPRNERKGYTCDAMFSWVDVAPTILDYCGVQPPEKIQGRSVLAAMQEEHPTGWDEIYCAHSFHEVTMYYPMRAVRRRKHKLIYNIAYPLPFPFASDLWESKTWQATRERGLTSYGKRTVAAYQNRPKFELYDLEADPDEVKNLADDPQHAALLADLKQRIRSFQEKTGDQWLLKWDRE